MALTTKIDASVEVARFQSAATAFDKFALAVRKSPGEWAQFGDQVKAAERTAGSITRILEDHSVHIARASQTQKRFADAARTAGSLFGNLARDTRAVADNLARSASSLLSISILTGAVGGLLGFAGGLFGADEMSRMVTARRRTAMGLGVGYGQLASVGLNFGRYGDAGAQLEAVSGALYNYTTPAYTALLASGGRPAAGKNAADELLDLYQRLPGLFAGVPEGEVGPKAEAMGLTQIMSVKEIIAYLRASPEEREAQVRHYRIDTQTLEVSAQAQAAWAKFGTALTRAGTTIETVLADKLTPLADPLNKLSDSVVKVFSALGNTTLVDDAVSKLTEGVDWLSGKFDSPEFRYGAQHFIDGLVRLGPLLKGVLTAASLAIPGSPYNMEVRQRMLDQFRAARGEPRQSVTGGPLPPLGAPGSEPLVGPKPSIRYGTRRWSGHAPSIDTTGTHGADAVDPGGKFWWEGGAAAPSVAEPSAAAAPPASVMPLQGETTDQLAARIQTIYPTFTNQQCVELARKTAGISEGVWDWRRGSPATVGLPVATPVATFLDRAGQPSEYYDAHQGVGAPGNNTTHAAVIAGYTKDGIILAEQYTGSGGPRMTEYKYGDPRGGEKDAANYFAINDPLGMPAGTHNPYRTQVQAHIAGDRFAGGAMSRQNYANTHRAGVMHHFQHGRQKPQMTSYLDHYQGAKTPKAVIVQNMTDGNATATHSRQAYG